MRDSDVHNVYRRDRLRKATSTSFRGTARRDEGDEGTLTVQDTVGGKGETPDAIRRERDAGASDRINDEKAYLATLDQPDRRWRA